MGAVLSSTSRRTSVHFTSLISLSILRTRLWLTESALSELDVSVGPRSLARSLSHRPRAQMIEDSVLQRLYP